MRSRFQKVAILAPGLIGGSLALALRARVPGMELSVWARREAAAKEAAERLQCFASTELEPVVTNADVVVFCMPIDAVEVVARGCASFIAKDALVTDACSVKRVVVEGLEPIFGEQFVGAHPMAGGEQTGIGAARGDLFEGAVCLLTPTERTGKEFLTKAEDFWQTSGCTTRCMAPGDHDLAVGYVSHLPHVAAAMIVEALRRVQPEWQAVSGPGYRDTTRVAAGSSALWSGILMANRTAVLEALRSFIGLGEELVSLIQEGNEPGLVAILEGARKLRERL